MNDDIELYMDGDSNVCYLESLVKAMTHMSHLHKFDSPIMVKFEQVINAELDLALLGAEKAKSDILKANAKDNVKPLKGA